MNEHQRETKRRAEIMLAYAEGKQIQCRALDGTTKWIDASHPFWFWKTDDYRIKPEPREWWVNVYPRGICDHLHDSRQAADSGAGCDRTACIRVREVLEDSE